MIISDIEAEIRNYMPLEDFLRIQERVAFLRKEEEDKLKALAELQKIYLAANTDQQRDQVKEAVAQIREMSRKTREELRELNSIIHRHLDVAAAKQLYERYLSALSHKPK
jgi:hypothetical protein